MFYFINNIEFKRGRDKVKRKSRIKAYSVGLGGIKRLPDFQTTGDRVKDAQRFRDREIKAGRIKKGLFER